MQSVKSITVVLKLLLIVASAVLCFCCVRKDDVYRGIYNGLTQNPIPHNEIKDPAYGPPMTCDQYKSERDRVLNEGREYGGTRN